MVKLLTSFLILFVLSSCSMPMLQKINGEKFNAPTEYKTGYARLFIFRPDREINSCCWSEVSINGTYVFDLLNNGYTFIYIKPGKYKIKGPSYFSSKKYPEHQSNKTFTTWSYDGDIEIKDTGDYLLMLNYITNKSNNLNVLPAGNSPIVYSESETKILKVEWLLSPRNTETEQYIKNCSYIPPKVNTIDF